MTATKSPKGKTDARREVVRRKSDDERREAMVRVLATAEEKEAWKAAANAEGMSVSTWLRHVAIKASRPA